MNEDKAVRYHRLKRRARVASAIGGVALLAAFLLSGASAWLRDASAGVSAFAPSGWQPSLTVSIYVFVLFFGTEAYALPWSVYQGFLLDHRYGLGNETFAQWLSDAAKATLIGLLLALMASILVYWLLRVAPAWWWLPAAAVFSAFSVLITFAAPILLFPLFYRFAPLERESLRARLMDLASRAGTRVLGVYEWKLGEKSRAANAALVGLGHTRRIVISDTLLGAYSDDEIEVILAHELAHHVNGDIRTMISADAAQTAAMLLASHVALIVFGASLGLHGPADVAGLPLLLLVAAAWSLLTLPAVNAWSRSHERRADRYALDLTHNPEAFVSAMRRLGSQNLADEHPARVVEWLFHSHPPLPQRVDAARAWTPPAAR
jgi:STE24 endopeptidase